MYVRNRSVALPHGGSLARLVKSCALPEAGALVDCEISLGRVRDATWLIGRSSLPFRVKTDLAPSFSIDCETIEIKDITAAGKPYVRHWKIVDVDARQLAAEGKI